MFPVARRAAASRASVRVGSVVCILPLWMLELLFLGIFIIVNPVL
jgi:hypothetical protein